MSTLTFRAFVLGPSPWQARSPWHPLLAVLAAIAVVVVGQIAPIAIIGAMSGGSIRTAPTDASPDAIFEVMEGSGATIVLLGQAFLGLLTIGVASLYRADSAEVLSLVRPAGGNRAFLFALIVMAPVLTATNAVAYALSPSGFMADFDQFAKLAQTSQPVTTFVAIAIGAPFWEEMLFRGFLLAPLSRPLGFWPAAVLVSGGWTALHIGYSIAGLAEVFLIGIYFSWLLWRTGSLWVPIACHAAYNAVLFAAMRYMSI
jgi:membrane protease YdiL (CAAX protease family)